MGNPPQMINFKVDTTTPQTAIPLNICNNYDNPCYASNYYNPNISSTANYVPCSPDCNYCTDPDGPLFISFLFIN